MNGRADCLMKFLMRSAGTKRGRYMLTTDRLREILTAAIDQEAGTYVDALQARRMLPDDGTALTPRSVIVALLALISGEETDAAISAALGSAEYQMAAVTFTFLHALIGGDQASSNGC